MGEARGIGYNTVKSTLCLLLFFCCSAHTLAAPDSLAYEKEYRHTAGGWLGFYTKYKVNEKWSYYGEYHVRRRNGLNDMAQIYLRFGLSHRFSNHSEFTFGVVNPYYWAPEQDAPNIDKVVPQYRGWQQFVFATPFDRLIVYHQVRAEQRFKRDYIKGSPFKFTFRYRYKLTAYYPINNPDYHDPHTLFLSFYSELFMQFGKMVTYNHLEDFRSFIGLGYVLNPALSMQLGYMNTYRHDKAPDKMEIRHIVRLSFYHHLDFHEKNHGRDIIHAH